jgi:hypothetical protein
MSEEGKKKERNGKGRTKKFSNWPRDWESYPHEDFHQPLQGKEEINGKNGKEKRNRKKKKEIKIIKKRY